MTKQLSFPRVSLSAVEMRRSENGDPFPNYYRFPLSWERQRNPSLRDL